jgi:hypothetical protein
MVTEALIQQIKALPIGKALALGDDVFSKEEKAVIEAAFYSIKGKRIKKCSCRNRYTDAAMEVVTALKIKPKKFNPKFVLKAGHIISIGTSYYNNYNLTDEVARQWCKAHPSEVKLKFQKYEITTTDEPIENSKVAEKV